MNVQFDAPIAHWRSADSTPQYRGGRGLKQNARRRSVLDAHVARSDRGGRGLNYQDKIIYALRGGCG